jgi:hypothetical protein
MIAECPTDVMFESVHNPNDIDYLRSPWDSADQIISITYNPDQHDYMVFWKEKVPCSDCHKQCNCLARKDVQE